MHSKRMHNSRGVPRTFRTRGREWIFVPLFLVCLLAFTNSPAWAQVFVGSVTGVVTDPTGAVVPGANVTLADTTKGYEYKATTDGVGRYVIRQLPPSTYQLKVEAQGFKTYVQEGIVLAVSQSSSIDVALELGATAQSVEVVGASPVLSTQDAAIGQDVSRTFINDLPLVGREVFNLAMLAPGVSQAPNRTYGDSSNHTTNFVSDGNRNATAEILIDGVTTTTAEPNTGINSSLYQPSVDAVQEFKMEQGNLSADKGSSSSTQINMVMRSGTNAFHGSAWEYLRNDKLMSNNWFNNRAGIGIPARRFNQFGATVGGPIIKDRTFFFFDYEGTRSLDATTASAGVPSAAMREGDFGEICPEGFDASGICANPDHQIWDPYSRVGPDAVEVDDEGNPEWTAKLTVPVPFNNLATYQSVPNAAGTDSHARLAGTGFEIPQQPGNTIDPTAYKIMQYYPLPNVAVGTSAYSRFDNWTGAGVNQGSNDQFDIRIDHRFSDRNLFNARFSYATGTYHNFNCFGTALDPCTQGPGAGGSRMFTMSDTFSFGPLTVLNVAYGITRWSTYTKGIAQDFPDFDPIADLGLPDYLRTAGVVASPTYYIYGGYGFAGGQSIGAQAWSVYRNGSEVHHLMAALSRIQGRHELKFGGDVRIHRMNWFQSGAPGGVHTYAVDGTRELPWDASGGDGMASFLTGSGYGGWGEYDIDAHMSTQSPKYDLYFQDNWRVTDKLTVGLGLRYDLEIPRTERYNRMNWWDLTVAQPTLAVANPDLTGDLPAGAALQQDYSNIVGGLVFASPDQRTTADTDGNNFGPRISLAYRVTDKLVIRTGYGLFYNPSLFGTAGAGQGGIDGFSGTTNWRNTYNGDDLTIWGRPSNPFPDGLIFPTGNSLGVLQSVGSGPSAPVRYDNATAYTQTWSFGIQRELPGSILVDASYVGTKGTKLNWLSAGEQNRLPAWIESATDDQIAYLRSQVDNPFYGVITSGDVSTPTVAASQLLMPYPQFSQVVVYNAPWANSQYHSFQLRVDKRFSKGLQFLATYTNSKSTSDGDLSTWTGWLGGTESRVINPNNRRLDHSLSEADISQIFQVAYVYQLPWGRGKKWGANWHPVVDAVLGGWQTNGIWRFDTGQPIRLGCESCTGIITYDHQQPNLSAPLEKASGSRVETMSQYFANPEVASVPEAYTLGNAPRMLPNIRKPGTNNAALSLFKEISLNAMREGSRLEFRAEAFNALNHPQFCGPNTSVGSGGFGMTTSQCNVPREFQMALRLYW
jgi:hypothetical protein